MLSSDMSRTDKPKTKGRPIAAGIWLLGWAEGGTYFSWVFAFLSLIKVSFWVVLTILNSMKDSWLSLTTTITNKLVYHITTKHIVNEVSYDHRIGNYKITLLEKVYMSEKAIATFGELVTGIIVGVVTCLCVHLLENVL